MGLAAWVWLSAAIVLLVAEILSPGLLMLPFAIGSAAAFVAAANGATAGWQWIAFVGVSGVLTVVFQRFIVGRRKR